MAKNFILKIIVFLILGTPLSWGFEPFSTKELDEIEKEFVQIINESNSIIRHPLARQYLNYLGHKLAKNAKQPLPDFFIVKSNEINAFAGPGGHIGIHTQLILATKSESELAGVMAHEMAHVRLHHLYRMIQHEKQKKIPLIASMLASAALGIINPVIGSGAMMATLTGAQQDSINYTRANEKEADRIGIDMLKKSGLNPKGMIDFFKKMQKNSELYFTAHIPPILRSHPLDRDRIAEAENRISIKDFDNNHYAENPSYPYFKELIRNLTATDPKKLLDYYETTCQVSPQNNACYYGLSLAFIKSNQIEKAQEILIKLYANDNDSIYILDAYIETLLKLGRIDSGLKLYHETYRNYPENYAVSISYADKLFNMGKYSKAVDVLIKAQRIYKKDLQLCLMLSQAQSEAGMKSYAYFTLAQCELIQGRSRSAMLQLKTAKKLSKNDPYLQARIEAKIEEVKFIRS